MYHLLAVCAFLSLLTPLVISEEYLFESGVIAFQNNISKRWYKNNQFKNVKHIDQHLMPGVVVFKIITPKMPILFEGSVKNLPYLQKMRMPKCGIEKMVPQAFQNLPNLTTVHLQDNDLEVIEEGVFNYLPIAELFLQRNKIRTIRSASFDHMPNLFLIQMNANKLTKWDSDWFKNTPKLTRLYFRRNQIKEIPPRAFANIQTSHKVHGHELVDLIIYLSKNRISRIHIEAFYGIDSIHQLWLDRNRIVNIDKRTFSQMSQLHSLYLGKNQLIEIDKDTFKNLDKMLLLQLTQNRLTCLPYEVVSMVSKVILNGNSIDCSCLFDLRTKLKDEGIDNEIKDNNCNFD